MRFFCITKPIQYFNALNVVSTLEKSGRNYLLVANEFTESRYFFDGIMSHSENWFKGRYLDKRYHMFLWLICNAKNSDIYIDSDYAKDSLFVKLLILNGNRVYIYEEGVFTYNPDLFTEYSKRHRLKISLYRALHLPKSIGMTKALSGIYIYNYEKFKRERAECKVKVNRFKYSFLENYLANKKELDIIFKVNDLSVPKDIKVIYCGPKSSSDISPLPKNIGRILFKPHPGCKISEKKIRMLLGDDIHIVNTNIPIEILSVNLLSERKVTFYHHNSSAIMYLADFFKKVVNLEERF